MSEINETEKGDDIAAFDVRRMGVHTGQAPGSSESFVLLQVGIGMMNGGIKFMSYALSVEMARRAAAALSTAAASAAVLNAEAQEIETSLPASIYDQAPTSRFTN